jgi:hypothetical protein
MGTALNLVAPPRFHSRDSWEGGKFDAVSSTPESALQPETLNLRSRVPGKLSRVLIACGENGFVPRAVFVDIQSLHQPCNPLSVQILIAPERIWHMKDSRGQILALGFS